MAPEHTRRFPALAPDYPLVIGHRGASRYLPENSVEAAELAIAQGADMIEMDVRCTADGVLVAYHDPNVQGLLLRTLTLDRLRAAVPHIATVSELLDVASGRVMVDLDVKMVGLEEAVLESLAGRTEARDVLITSFSPRVVRRFRCLDASLVTGWIVGTRMPQNLVSRLRMTGAEWLVAEWACLNARVVAECRAHDVALAVWTVNEPAEVDAAIHVPGLAGVITDVPDVARHIRDLYTRERSLQPAL